MRRFIGKWRLWWGLCPLCNSDAPEIDTCPVCYSSREFPPTPEFKAGMWKRFCHTLRQREKGAQP